MVKYSPVTPAFVYECWLGAEPKQHVTAQLQMPALAGGRACTALLTASQGPDERHEEWCRVENDKLTVICLFGSFTLAVLAISLTKEQKLFILDASTPHISLARSADCRWEDLGRFVHSCNRACD